MTAPSRDLLRLARLYGVQTAYDDVRGRRTRASAETMLAVLAARGVTIRSPADAPVLLAEEQRRRLDAGLEPVVVCWNRWPLEVPMWVRPAQIGRTVRATILLEQGDRSACSSELRVAKDVSTRGREGRGAKCRADAGKGADRGGARVVRGRSWPGGLEQAAAAYGFLAAVVPIEGPLPLGYHRLRIEVSGKPYEAWLVVAPRQSAVGQGYGGSSRLGPDQEPTSRTSQNGQRDAGLPRDLAVGRGWGCFLPLYALRTARDWGAGSYGDLAALAEWTGSLGGSVMGTLPLLPCFLDTPLDPSPYAPVSRLMWSEFYIDVPRLPELRAAPEISGRLVEGRWRAALEELRSRREVDYRGVMSRKRQVLEELSRVFFDRAPAARREEFERFLRSAPEAERYARFRAACEAMRRPWWEWPHTMQADRLASCDVDGTVEQYYLYAQFVAHQQLAETVATAHDSGVELYLDLPIGVRSDGFDPWREPQLFARSVSAGAPPDGVFANGQNWGFPPLEPEALRRSGYRYVVDVLRHHLRTSGLLRIDHVMGLHRLYWIPEGMPATDGVYVRYAADELYAVLCLEAHRHSARLVGENLGTVPGYVNRALRRHRLRTMYVVQYEYAEGVQHVAPAPSRRSVASVNTHDMPTFAAWYAGRDIDDRLALGFLDRQEAARARADRALARQLLVTCLQRAGLLDGTDAEARDMRSDKLPPCETVLAACLAYLAESDAELALASLEDLWLEVESQNVPGTSNERPNWRRKARYRLEEFREMQAVLQPLGEMAQRRRARRTAKPRGTRRTPQSGR